MPDIPMPDDDPILAELAAKLAETETWDEESREKLGRTFEAMRGVFAKMAAKADIPPEERERLRRDAREKWLEVFEVCRKIEAVQDTLLHKGADLAEAMRKSSMATVRIMHQMKTAIDAGEFTGTWEQREEMLGSIREFEEHKQSFLEDLTADDIQQLREEGVL